MFSTTVDRYRGPKCTHITQNPFLKYSTIKPDRILKKIIVRFSDARLRIALCEASNIWVESMRVMQVEYWHRYESMRGIQV